MYSPQVDEVNRSNSGFGLVTMRDRHQGTIERVIATNASWLDAAALSMLRTPRQAGAHAGSAAPLLTHTRAAVM